MGIIEMELLHDKKLRDQNHIPGNHHRAEIAEKNLIPARKFQLGKGVSRPACRQRLPVCRGLRTDPRSDPAANPGQHNLYLIVIVIIRNQGQFHLYFVLRSIVGLYQILCDYIRIGMLIKVDDYLFALVCLYCKSAQHGHHHRCTECSCDHCSFFISNPP